jgi:hypothetical protein
MNFMFENKAKYDAYAPLFQSVFKVRLWDFFDMIYGFDIVKFDEIIIKSPDGESCADVVHRDYGDRGVDLINLLIG